MVFLTMLPEEFEHTREPAYNNDLYWPPVCNLQPFSNSTSQSDKLETVDACSSQNGSIIKEFVSLKDSTPPSEVSLEHFVAKNNATATIKPILLVQEQAISEEKILDVAQTPSTAILPPILEHSISVVTSVEPLPSENVKAEGEILISSNELHSSKISLPGKFRVW